MEFVWFLLGLVLAAVAVWFWLERKSSERLAAADASWDGRLRHAVEEVRQADQAHEETKQRLIASELAVRGLDERIQALEADLDQAATRAARMEASRDDLLRDLDRGRHELAEVREAAEQAGAEATRLRGDLAAREQRLGELEARHAAAQAAAVDAKAAAKSPDAVQQRLKKIEARIAMLPAGSSARTALMAEKAKLQQARPR
jgi:chromosome segregation ATPase